MLRSVVLAAGIGVVAMAAPVQAAEEFTGRLASGAYYHVEVPDGWQPGDALVLYQHGLDFTTPSSQPELGELRTVMLGEGFSIAGASRYKERSICVAMRA